MTNLTSGMRQLAGTTARLGSFQNANVRQRLRQFLLMDAGNSEFRFEASQVCPPTFSGPESCDDIDDREALALEPTCVSENVKVLSRRRNLIVESRGWEGTLVDTDYTPRWSKNHTVWAQGFSSHHSPNAVTPVSFDGR